MQASEIIVTASICSLFGGLHNLVKALLGAMTELFQGSVVQERE